MQGDTDAQLPAQDRAHDPRPARGLSVSVVIPAFNEREAIAGVIEGVRGALERRVEASEIIVVDDGSSDGTMEAARGAGAKVLSHPANRGYGQALTTGIQAARHEWILMTDADGSYPAADIPKLLESVPAFDLVIGARTGAHYWGTSAQAFRRWVYLQLARFVVGEPVPDANSGLRILRRSMALNTGPVECLGYSFSTTMTLSFLKSGRFVKFVPIAYEARTGESKVKMARDVLRTLQLMTQVLIAYNPLKLFATLAAIPGAAAGLLLLGWLICGSGAVLLSAAVLAAAAMQCFMAGCILDAIRMQRRNANP